VGAVVEVELRDCCYCTNRICCNDRDHWCWSVRIASGESTTVHNCPTDRGVTYYERGRGSSCISIGKDYGRSVVRASGSDLGAGKTSEW